MADPRDTEILEFNTPEEEPLTTATPVDDAPEGQPIEAALPDVPEPIEPDETAAQPSEEGDIE